MRGNEFLDKMDLVDPIYVEKADSSTERSSHKRKIVLLVAAAVLTLLATGAAWLHIAISEVRTDESPSAAIKERIEALQLVTFPNEIYIHFNQLLEEHEIAEEDIVGKSFEEYLSHGYYFDEMIVVTKDKAVCRMVTDADNFTFDVEFVGLFYSEESDEFKTVTKTTTAPDGMIEIVMNTMEGWECIGGIYGRSHPEEESNRYGCNYTINFNHKASDRAQQFVDNYRKERQFNPENSAVSDESEMAIQTLQFNQFIPEDILEPKTNDNPSARIKQILSRYGIKGISDDKTFYNKEVLSSDSYIETGCAYNEDKLIAFIFHNNTEPEKLRLTTVFYNAEKDEYRLIHRDISDTVVIKFDVNDGWECIGVCLYRYVYKFGNFKKLEGMESLVLAEDFVPVEGDEEDSYEFWAKVLNENYEFRQLADTKNEDK